MKCRHNLQTASVMVSVLMVGLVGCASKERVVTYDVTTSGKNWAENETIQERKGSDGKIVIEKQKVFEKVRCVGQKGKHKGKIIKVDSPEECLKMGGKIIDEVMVEEQTIQNK